MKKEVAHGFEEETMESKALWFQSLPISERMEMLCMFTDMILENNPDVVEKRDAKSLTGSIQVLERAYSLRSPKRPRGCTSIATGRPGMITP